MPNIIKPPTIVFPGSWNPAILQPKWIASEIFNQPELLVNIEFTTVPTEPPKFTIEDISFIPSHNRLAITPNTCNEEDLSKAESVSKSILEKLKHTPTKCFGNNFEYIEENPDTNLYTIFDLNEDLEGRFLAAAENISTKISRGFQLDGRILNLTRAPKDGKITFNFNFHYETASAEESSEKIEGTLMNDLEIIRYFLNSYNIHPENLNEVASE